MIYLKHDFSIYKDSKFFYKCNVCNLIVWVSMDKCRFFIKETPDDVQFNIKLNITCDEMIIKNIIE
jgi:hypothetical protein